MATSLNDVIHQALRLAGAIGAGETLDGDDTNDALTIAKELMRSWNVLSTVTSYEKVRTEFTLGASQQTFTIGASGADFTLVRPQRLSKAGILLVGNDDLEIPLTVYMDSDRWARVALKGTTSTYPSELYYQPSFPLGKLNLYPIPTETSNKLVLYTDQQLSIVDLSTDLELTLPPGYIRAFKYNLAIELAPEFGVTPGADVYEIAATSKGDLQIANQEDHVMGSDFGGSGSGYNIYTGE